MSKVRRAAACTLLSLAVLTPTLSASATTEGGSSARHGTDGSTSSATERAERRSHRALRLEQRYDLAGLSAAEGPFGAREGEESSESLPPFVGIDGLLYDRAPTIVDGRNGTVYIGQDFDGACYWGPRFPNAMRKLARLATIIERSGRRVVFTVAPNKSSANKGDLPEELPHGACDQLGMTQQDALLDTLPDPRYLGLRDLLARNTAAGRPMFWHIDTHWTTVGGTQYAQKLAQRLDPRVARLQRYRNTEETILVDYNAIGLMEGVTETGPARFPTTRKVRVQPRDGSKPFDPVDVSPDLSWVTRPHKKAIKGETLLLGDSFTYRALPSLLPLFHKGRFIWTGQESMKDTARAVRKADTVVLEVVQRYLPISAIVSKELRRAVADALR